MYTINDNWEKKQRSKNLDALSGFSLQKESILLGTMLGRQNPLCIPILVKYSGNKNKSLNYRMIILRVLYIIIHPNHDSRIMIIMIPWWVSR